MRTHFSPSSLSSLAALGLFVVALAGLEPACGAAAPEAKSPAPPALKSEDAPAAMKAPPGGYPQPSSSPQSLPQSQPAQQPMVPSSPGTPTDFGASTATPAPPSTEPPDSDRRRQAALRTARAEVDVAKRELEAGIGECSTACRALGSMERATGHLCDLASETDDRRRCEDAKTLVQRARDRVRAACGTCPGGPSLERSAPIPSIK